MVNYHSNPIRGLLDYIVESYDKKLEKAFLKTTTETTNYYGSCVCILTLEW